MKSIPVKGGWVFQPTVPAKTKVIASEGRIFGKRYYTVGFEFTWDLAGDWGGADSWEEMQAWCEETFGAIPEDGFWTQGQRWYTNDGKFWFRDAEDQTLFLLRWQ